MKKSKKRWIALQISAPALTIFGFGLYYYIQHYDFLYSKALVGPLSSLALFVWAGYALTLYPKTLHLLRHKTPAELRIENWLKTPFYYIPIALLILAFVVGWMYFTRAIMQWAAGPFFPGLAGLLFILALLMLGQEVMKYLDRRAGLRNYLAQKNPAQGELKLSPKQLKVLVIVQSIFFITFVWLGFTVATLLLLLAKDFLSDFLVILGIIIAFTPVIMGMIKLELKLEKWGRDQLYIPWKSY